MLIGREKESKELTKLLETDKSELVAIYGRRRVGKTFLINEIYKDQIIFRHTGMFLQNVKNKNTALKMELESFQNDLRNFNLVDYLTPTPDNWLKAFSLLEKGIREKYNNKRVVLFLDELSWMDTPDSYFIEALSNFWNNYCFPSKNIILVVCGSSSSWLLDKIIYDKGGLYHRVTYQLQLFPFNLNEVEQFLNYKNIHYSRYEIAQLYMMVGGIPYYLDYLRNDYSLPQNIDNLFFNEDSHLPNEFSDLFSSQFIDYEKYQGIVEFLGTKSIGYTSNEIAEKLFNNNPNGKLYNMLNALERGGFIMSYNPFNESKRIKKYKLIDPFCLFYIKQIAPNKRKNNYWEKNFLSPKINTWRGLAFENLCYNHINQIKNKMSILGLESEVSLFNQKGDENTIGSQIDLLLIRKDNIVNLCEMKFYNDKYSIDKDSHLNLMRKMESLYNVIPKRASIQNVLVTTFGLSSGMYSSDYPIIITVDDLFE